MGLNMGEWILTSSIFILLVLLIRLIFKKWLTAKIRYSIWFLVLLRLLLPFSFFDSSFSLLNFIPRQESEIQIVQADGAGLPMQQEIMSNSLSSVKPLPTANPLQTLQTQSAGSHIVANHGDIPQNKENSFFDTLSIKKMLFICWYIGMIAALLIIAGSNLYFVKNVKKSRKMTEILQNRQSLPVYTSENVPFPCMFGLFKPAIYVRNHDTEDKVTLSYILKHENTHYRHRDHIWAFFRGLCLILHWYNPLVWIAAYCSKQDAELFCDESVIRPFSAEEAEAYGKVLIGLSIQNIDYRTVLSCATTLSSGKNNLKERINRIAGRPQFFICSTAAVVILCIGALVFTFTGNSKRTVEEDRTAGLEDESVVGSEAPENNPLEEPADITLETPKDEPLAEPVDRIPQVAEDGLFINDYLVDMNGDGIKDVLRLSNINDAPLDTSLTESEALRKAVEENTAGYYQIALYDGAHAADMQNFRIGDELNEDALITTFEPGQAHAGNTQYSYYEENGRGYLIDNCPYFGQEVVSYQYLVFTYTSDWKQETIAEDHLSFFAMPYSPELTRMSPYEYMTENFSIEDMIAYTMEIKDYLDKAVIIMDTSIFGEVLFTTYYENSVLTPNAFAIWYWDDAFQSVNSEETLREALYNALLYQLNGITPYLTGKALALVNELGWEVTYWWDMPPANRSMTYMEYMRNQPETLERVPENALTMEYNIVDYAVQCVEANVNVDQEQRYIPWVDWKITYLNFYGTYRMGAHTLDVYRYDYYCKLDENTDVNNLGEGTFWAGGMMDMGDGWYQFDYGNCVIYDRENDNCFHAGSNDSYPGTSVFTSDLLIHFTNQFEEAKTN
ncbi:MAG: M56 family metallopeptidase [Lachnospiraceae bacterium]|nr:M56 family metallopeptidase [Lachnospiraceae bacterium]